MMMNIDNNAWQFDGSKLASLRDMKGLTQNDFALRIGAVKQQVSTWEKGKFAPSIRTLLRICNTFNVVPGYFFVEEHHNTPDNPQEGK